MNYEQLTNLFYYAGLMSGILLIISISGVYYHSTKDKCELCDRSLSKDHNGLFFGNCVGNADKTIIISDELQRLIEDIELDGSIKNVIL